MKTPLQQYSDDDLQQELIQREADRRAEENKRNIANAQLILQNVDVLLSLVPKHDSLNCSDDHPISGYLDHGHARCRRCMLLHIKQVQFNDDVGLEIDLVQLYHQDNTPSALQVIVKNR